MKPFCEGCHNNSENDEINGCFYHLEETIQQIDICPCKECILFSCCSCSCQKWLDIGNSILWNNYKIKKGV
jgi:hypothetical protein